MPPIRIFVMSILVDELDIGTFLLRNSSVGIAPQKSH